MGQSRPAGYFLLILVIIGLTACGKNDQTALPPPKPAVKPTVASLVPAATDLLIGMGLGDHLVAVSNFEPARDVTRDLPRVGDYQTTDWERLRALHPDLMIVQIAPDRMPAGLLDNAARLNIRVVNIKLNRLTDIFTTMGQLGDALSAPQTATLASVTLGRQIEAVRKKNMGHIPTLLAVGDSGQFLAGPGTYLDDLITISGGQNVAAKLNNPYPAADRETLVSLKPQVILQLLPGGSAQLAEKSRQFWLSIPELPAVKYGRVYVLTDADALLPGYNVARLAEEFSRLIHLQVPSTSPSASAGNRR